MNYPDKIEVVLTYKHDSESSEIFTECVDAVRFGEHFQLVAAPTFASNLAFGDIIKTEFDDGEYHFEELIQESGHSVVHVVIFNIAVKTDLISNLQMVNCRVNGEVADNYLVLDILPTVPYQPIHSLLADEESLENLSFRESCLSTVHALITK